MLADPRFAWARDLGLAVPVISAPMGGAAGGRLAAAVSKAGGLGTIGSGSSGSVPSLERELSHLPSDGTRFGIGLVDWVVRRNTGLLERALDAAPALLSVGFGDWGPESTTWIDRAARSGAVTAAQISTVDEARKAEDAGIDILVARGLEAGGHGAPDTEILPLLEATLNATSRPVLAAGAITNGRDLVRVLNAGAAGGWVGTAFAASEESLLSDDAKQRLITATADDTVVSRVVDTALGYPWPTRYPERIVRTAFVDEWTGREDELLADPVALQSFRDAESHLDYSVVPVNAGTGVTGITRLRTADDIVRDFARALEGSDTGA